MTIEVNMCPFLKTQNHEESGISGEERGTAISKDRDFMPAYPLKWYTCNIIL